MLILSADEVERALPMPAAIAAMKEAFAALSAGRASAPPRIHLPVARNGGASLIMPAFLDADDPAAQALAVKVVSLFDGNRARGLARIQAAVVVLEPDTGRPAALLEGATLTAIRTAAASGAATDLLARPDSRVAALFGAGVQALRHAEALCTVRPIEELRVFSRTPQRLAAFCEALSRRPTITTRIVTVKSPAEAVRHADVVCTATTSAVPVFDDADLPAGVHVNAVGSYTPEAREVPAETVVRALVVVDSRNAAWDEAGDLIQPLRAGQIGRDHIHAELGEVVLGRRPGRTGDAQTTFFKSVGIAVQDAAAARAALAAAEARGLGTRIAW